MQRENSDADDEHGRVAVPRIKVGSEQTCVQSAQVPKNIWGSQTWRYGTKISWWWMNGGWRRAMCEREREPTDPVACGAQTSVDGGGTGGWRRAVRASEREKERESRSPVCASLRRKSVGGGGTGGWGGGLKAGCASEREPIPRVRQPAAQISWWWRNRRVKVGCASERERAESSRARRQPAAQISWWRSTGGGWRGARCARAGENQSRSRAPACGAYQLGEVRDVAWATPQWSGERRQKPPLRAVCATRVCRARRS